MLICTSILMYFVQYLIAISLIHNCIPEKSLCVCYTMTYNLFVSQLNFFVLYPYICLIVFIEKA